MTVDPGIRETMLAAVPGLRAFAMSLCGKMDRADDLVQETLLRALTNIDSFEPGTNMSAWLFTILRNLFRSEYRKRRREVEGADGRHVDSLKSAPQEHSRLEFEEFRRALAKLLPHQREALILVGASGFSYEEAAAVCDCAAVDDDCVITRLEKGTMIATIHNEPEFSELFMSYLLTRNSRIEEDLIDQLFNSSEKRLARLLLLLANFGKEGTPEPIVGKYSQEMLAEMIGTTRSRVSFFMNRFRKLGFIEYNGKLEVHKSLLNMILQEKPEIRTKDEARRAE